MAQYTPTVADVRNFVENLEEQAADGNPHLGAMWEILTYLHKDLVEVNTQTMKPLSQFHDIPPFLEAFAAVAYEWLALNYKQGTIRDAIGRI
ncbi:hypothetical protein B0T20DRAFT_336717, partial [Sordaria brevicollis]